MEGSAAAHAPLRIEMATAQIEGGQAVGWVDPGQVIGCVAYCEPRDAFERFVLPHLENTKGTPPEGAEALPASVAALVTGLKAAHLRLFRENHSLMKEPKWVRLTCACAEESRIYFAKTQTSWVYLLRGEQAFLVGDPEVRPPAQANAEALGGQEKLRLQVTSLEVSGDDQVLLVSGDADEPPDQRAIARLFAESKDLKRACDGLVNLLGLQGPSASVVAFRFAPLLEGRRDEHLDPIRGEEVLAEISSYAHELVLAAQEEPLGMDELIPLRGMDDVAEAAEAETRQMRRTPAEPSRQENDIPAPILGSTAPAELPQSGGEPTANRWKQWITSPSRQLKDVPPPPTLKRRGGRSLVPVFVLAIALFLLAAAILSSAGWPSVFDRVRAFFSSQTQGPIEAPPTCVAEIRTEPPGAIVAIDGERLAGRTPLRRTGVRPGMREVSIHLGAVGAWSDSILFAAGDTARIHTSFIGRLEVAAADLSGNPRVWLEGQLSKQALPASFDDLPAGWYRVFFEDDRIPLWERKVLVRSGETAQMEVNNTIGAGEVLVHVESVRMVPNEGLRPMEGDSIFVNGLFAGLTPRDLELEPGLHGVRVVSGGEEHCEVLRLPAGSSRYVIPQFGLRARPTFLHLPPGTIALQGPIYLAVEIRLEQGRLSRPYLHLPEAIGGPRSIPLVKVDSGENLYVGKALPELVTLGAEVPYYFSVTTPEGDEAVSELYRFTPVDDANAMGNELSALAGSR